MIRRAAAVARALIGLHYSVFIAYRMQSALYMLSGALPLVMMLVWLGLARDGPVGGYGRVDFVLYFMFLFVVRQMTPIWAVTMLDRGIRLGELAPMLLRPLPPLFDHMAQHIAEIFVRLPVIVVFLLLGLQIEGAFHAVHWERLPGFLLSSMASWLIFFLIHYIVGLLAFWTESVRYLEGALYDLFIILGGSAIPVELFPKGVQAIIAWTPFPYILDLPVRLMTGRIEGAALWQGLAIQAAWAVLLLALRAIIWRRGLRRFSAMGA